MCEKCKEEDIIVHVSGRDALALGNIPGFINSYAYYSGELKNACEYGKFNLAGRIVRVYADVEERVVCTRTYSIKNR